MVEKSWLAVFIVTCALGLAVGYMLDISNYMCIVFAFVRYQQNHCLPLGTLCLCRGDWHSQIFQNIHWFIAIHIGEIGVLFCLEDKVTKIPRGDGTGSQQTSISKNALPNQVRWDFSQQWLQRFTFDGNCAEQLYSVQPLPICTSISINALFNKSPNHKSYLSISFTLALGFQAKGLAQRRRNSGRGSSKRVEGNASYKKQTVTNHACFCSATMLTSRLITNYRKSFRSFWVHE